MTAMQQSIRYQTPEPSTLNEPATSRLRTVTGNRWPRKCACGCNLPIPRGPDTRLVVDFGASRPYPAYLVEHSPDYARFRARDSPEEPPTSEPRAVPATNLLDAWNRGRDRAEQIAATEETVAPSPESGRPWASGQLVFNVGSFEAERADLAF